jgi:GrpB-like predicted nucleotidyltransferase (UPF0157 family)
VSDDGIVIVEYDARWPSAFAAEAKRIEGAARGLLVGIEHVGSTSVPGLAAKPVIDIMGGVRTLADADAAVPRIVAIGYEYVRKWEDEMPERRYFVRRVKGVRTHHLHVVETGSDFWRDHLLFRDHLRTHPVDVIRYAALKHDLAESLGEDREAYTDAKAEFIEACLAAARGGGR